jgi:hypothetical protein
MWAAAPGGIQLNSLKEDIPLPELIFLTTSLIEPEKKRITKMLLFLLLKRTQEILISIKNLT